MTQNDACVNVRRHVTECDVDGYTPGGPGQQTYALPSSHDSDNQLQNDDDRRIGYSSCYTCSSRDVTEMTSL